MTQYLDNLIKIHPHANYKPKHHMSMHLPHFFSLFGPVRSWWCFPFERLIGQIQRLLSNHKLGQMESTLLHSYLNAANLRRWLNDPNAVGAFAQIRDTFNKIYRSKHSDSNASEELVADEDSDKTLQAAPTDLQALLPFGSLVVLQARLKANDTIYSISKTHTGNSQVFYYPNGQLSSAPVPGIIQYIFLRTGRYSLAVRPLIPAERGVTDPFCIYPYFPAKLYLSQPSTDLELVQPNWVHGHYARWKFDASHSVVLSLSRVSAFLTCYRRSSLT